MLTEVDIQTALGNVIHPTYGMSLVMLHMVHAIRISPDYIEVDLVLNCPGCPTGRAVLARTQHALESLPSRGMGKISIRLIPQVWTPPWHSYTNEL